MVMELHSLHFMGLLISFRVIGAFQLGIETELKSNKKDQLSRNDFNQNLFREAIKGERY